MMNGGQPIDPGLVQALQSISTGQEDQQSLKQQMLMAQALKAPQLAPDAMAGKVVVPHSGLYNVATAGQNMLSQIMQAKTLKAMQDQNTKLRDARGQILSRQAAWANMQTDPTKNHPDTNAQLQSELSGTQQNPGMLGMDNAGLADAAGAMP